MANGAGAEGMSPEEMQRMEEIKNMLLRNVLTKKAKERLARVKLVKPDLAMQLELYLVQLYQTGKIRSKLTDEQLKTILESLASEKRFKIVRK
jgi:programmed cell death protein 5